MPTIAQTNIDRAEELVELVRTLASWKYNWAKIYSDATVIPAKLVAPGIAQVFVEEKSDVKAGFGNVGGVLRLGAIARQFVVSLGWWGGEWDSKKVKRAIALKMGAMKEAN